MPAILLERLPLPSLRSYVSFSVLVLALATFYAHQTVRTKMNFNPDTEVVEELGLPPELANITLPYSNDEHFYNLMYVMRVETWCIWTLVNTCYCLLILLGKLIQNIVFGELRVSEQQHLKDKFWNFVFYKFIFIFGVMNVQSMEEVVLWVAWFSALGFLHLLTQVCKDRFEYLSFSPATPRVSHVKLLSLLTCIFTSCCVLLAASAWVALHISLTICAFLGAECFLLLLKCLYVMLRYVIQLLDMNQEGVWEARSVYIYYSELTFELVALSVDFAHHLHMLLHGNIFLSMASLVICMQLRFLFYEFQRRIKRHKNYLKVVKDMEAKFPMATQEDLEHNADDCAICWEKMESARKLPCGHLFHNSCLRSWLEQDTSCPTCRTALSETPQGERNPMGPPGAPNVADGIVPPAPQGTTNHFFHFDGSRYVSWLPSFSVEVTHTNLLPGQQAHATQTSQLDNMAREVQVVFPSIPQQVIMEDLRVTRSVDQTIDNILEGRLIVPQVASISSTGHSRTESPGSPGESSSVTELTQVTQSMPPQPIMSADITETTTADSETTAAKTTAAREPTTADSDLLELSPQTGDTTGASAGHEEGQKFASNVSAGGRFSKSASERMSMLGQRKQAMIEQARRRYQAKLEKASNEKTSNDWTRSTAPKSSTAGGTAGIVEPSTHRATSLEQESAAEEQWRRRAVVLEATQRRLDRTSSSSS